MAAGAIVGSARAVFRSFAPGWAKLGWSANAMINEAKRLNISFRRKEMLTTTRWATGLAKLEAAARRADPDQLFPQYAMVPSDFRSARRYLIHAEIYFTDPVTGQSVTEHISFFDNTLKTKNQWLGDWFDKAAWTDSKEAAAIHGATIVSVEHKMGWAI